MLAPVAPVSLVHLEKITVSVVVPDIVSDVAVMIDVPTSIPAASPVAASIVATVVVLELHVTDEVISVVVLSEYVPVAVNCCVAALAIDGVAGVIAIDKRVAELPLVGVLFVRGAFLAQDDRFNTNPSIPIKPIKLLFHIRTSYILIGLFKNFFSAFKTSEKTNMT